MLYEVEQKLADGITLQIGKFRTLNEAREAILDDASMGSAKRRKVAAAEIDDDGLFYAGWNYGIFLRK